ncbi:hypothetical protein [Brevibacillus brevis]|uniref:Uncharacterized protein n=1 Tax=Brevibacillus brevis TaxID=1393 RepID=A0ABY9T0F6_BREBE|nr:hypothetical protein [Brevibacillus brevis]WNC13567.1 hypothetical protein RGB73_23165 [Brevibacillus brevis]
MERQASACDFQDDAARVANRVGSTDCWSREDTKRIHLRAYRRFALAEIELPVPASPDRGKVHG